MEVGVLHFELLGHLAHLLKIDQLTIIKSGFVKVVDNVVHVNHSSFAFLNDQLNDRAIAKDVCLS